MSVFRDPEFWRTRAVQTRAKVGKSSGPKPRIDLLKVAEEYDRLAARAEEWQRAQFSLTEDLSRDSGISCG